MNKLIPASLGLVGAGSLGIGGWIAFKPKMINPYKEKYKTAIIEEKSSLWETKFLALKGKSPINEKLKKAAGTSESEDIRKGKHKEGCREIYESSTQDSKYLDDFKQYCSKNNGDVLSSGWISEVPTSSITSTSSSKWHGKLTSLKNNKDRETHPFLKSLATKLTGDTFNKTQGDELKGWCDSQKGEIFLGDKDHSFQLIKSYCVEGNA
ncbi:hypothetical protein MHC_01465 [Mycoplasma haemocanis str. Illinois]|uniref:Uncharacterized protein n=1 Tax=Mycoplasma haemocanis (strain Illinois) TaxID=1111676 RepID=H6N687_MYCHN|nr:hypothetical protein [Mycoplasma haemocanis]AEW45159.1 hypothetical protein MHC_01465 [Mycoplasma haemocanis str. Illinois]